MNCFWDASGTLLGVIKCFWDAFGILLRCSWGVFGILLHSIECFRDAFGELLINGMSIEDNTNIDKLRNKSIGFVFQFHNLISELTLEENVSLPKMIAKEQLGKKELIELFEYFDLKDRMNSFPNDLSGGEKQRVAVMRAVINNPSIIIADEPTGNLDKENALKMMSLFQKLNTEKKLTIIIATHDEDVFNIGHKKYQLVDGCLELVH